METRPGPSARPPESPDESPTESLTDADLMARTARGDLGAFALLVGAYHARALRFANHLVRDREEARDVVQEGFLRLLRSAARYEARASLAAYLFTIMRNLVRSSRRRRREEPLAWDRASARVRGAAGRSDLELRDPVAVLAETERRGRIEQAIASLPDPLREVFVLSEIEGMSYKEIGVICKCPAGTVASRKHAAVELLRADLAPLRNGCSR